MKFHINSKNESGSVTIEVAMIMPIFISVLLFFISVFQIVAAENILNITTLKIAEKMCKWAPIYKNLMADNLQNNLFEKVGDKINSEFGEILNNEFDSFIMGIINLRKLGEYSFDYIYSYTAQQMCESELKQNKLLRKGIIKIKNLNMYKSDFFNNDSNYICINAVSEVETYLPFDVKISAEVRCASWGRGVMPHISVKDDANDNSSTASIWKKDNFTRGKVIRKMFGGNLPDTFPVIASFENGMASMIKSINHTASTYQSSSVFEKAIKRMIDELATFQGGAAGNISINSKDIISKRLVLVMPENKLSITQQKSLENLMRYATTKLIVLDLQRYQKV